MKFAKTQWAALLGHASTPSDRISGIDARVHVAESGAIEFHYVLRAKMLGVHVPKAKSPGRAGGLWKHTCFEAFVRTPRAAGYYELNFAPSRRWAIYRFDAYREGMSSAELAAAPEIAVRCFDDRLELDATVRLLDLIALQGAPRLQLALSAVVEQENGTLSYWALRHVSGKPDFHDPHGFVLELATQGGRNL
jgi:hypothetical protein